MKSFTTTLLALLFLAGAASSFAKAAKKFYAGSYKGQPCTVQMTWHNWDGLGPIDGVIKVGAGAIIPFSGSNSQTGVIDLNAAGESFHLVRRDTGRAASWSGARLSFTESAPTPTPTPTPSPSPSVAPDALTVDLETAGQMVDETYAGNWRGQECTVRIRWAPGDEPGIVRRGRGTITMPDGRQVSIEGSQPSTEAAEFTVKPGEGAETFKAIKGTRSGNPSWESESLILTEKK